MASNANVVCLPNGNAGNRLAVQFNRKVITLFSFHQTTGDYFREFFFGIRIYNTRLRPKTGITAIQTAVNFLLSSNIDTRQYLRAKSNIINLIIVLASCTFHIADFENRIANTSAAK